VEKEISPLQGRAFPEARISEGPQVVCGGRESVLAEVRGPKEDLP